MSKHNCFTVNGNKFFSVGVQLHNSSGYALGFENGTYYDSDKEKAFLSAKLLHANTVAIPICWDRFESVEGKFDREYVTNIVDVVRKHNLHLIVLWFGTWKNGQMEYVPSWVKCDTERFKRALTKDGISTTALSPFCQANIAADKAAFCELMKLIKEYDKDKMTVIAVQVENEAGMYAASIRDFSNSANELFYSPVPKEIISIAAKDCGLIHDIYINNGSPKDKNWMNTFGAYGAEFLMAWGIAKYIEGIAEAGKQIYDIFMYINVWQDRNSESGWSVPGLDYPSGGAVTKTLPIWVGICSSIDSFSPDMYDIDPEAIRKEQAYYCKENTAFYIPESGITAVNATMMFEAIGIHHAIGYHIFGAESALNDSHDGLTEEASVVARSFYMLENVKYLLEQYEDASKIHTFIQTVGQDSTRFILGNRICRVSYTGASCDFCGLVAMDWRHKKDLANANSIPMSLNCETARGLLFQENEDEFYLVGHRIRLYWQDWEVTDGSLPYNMLLLQHQAHSMEFLTIEEGHFDNNKYVVDHLRSGDEARHGIWAQYDCGVIHFVLRNKLHRDIENAKTKGNHVI